MKKNNTIMGSALLVMIVSLASKLLGFLRQVVIAGCYGSNMDTDIFFVSSEFMLGLSGALLASLTTALVTIYIDTATKKDTMSANKIASKMLTIFLLASGVFIAVINIFAPLLPKLIAPSYDTAASERLTVYLRFFSIVFIFTAFQSVYAAVLNANDSFTPGKLYGIIYNPMAIILVLLLHDKIGITALVIAYIAANIGQTLLLRKICGRVFTFRPSFYFNDESIKHLILMSLPLLISNIFIQFNGIIDKAICSVLGESIASDYSYAFTLEQFVTATITVTLSIVLLSKYAQYVAKGDTEKVINTFKKSIGGLILLLLPITVVASVMAYDIVCIVYLRGEFGVCAARDTSYALVGFALGFVPVAIREMYIRLHLAYQDTKMPMATNIVSVFINAVLSIFLAKYIGILGISAATSISVFVTVIILNKSAKKYIPEFKFFSMYKLILKAVAAAIIATVCVVIAKRFMPDVLLIRFTVLSAVVMAVYILVLLLLRCEELKEFYVDALDMIRAKFKR